MFGLSNRVVWLAIFLIVAYFLNCRMTAGVDKRGKDWTVYGTMGCGWTRKQLDYMKSKKIPHKFVNCDSEDCGDVTSFPTLKKSDGAVLVGFNNSL